MREKRGGFAEGRADKMTIQGQLGSSGADGWSLRWVSRNIKTPSQRPLLVPRTGALGAHSLVELLEPILHWTAGVFLLVAFLQLYPYPALYQWY